jgi:hypothetical protein
MLGIIPLEFLEQIGLIVIEKLNLRCIPCCPCVLLPELLLGLRVTLWWLLDSREVKFGELRLRWLEGVAAQYEALPLMLRVHKEVIVERSEVEVAPLARLGVGGLTRDGFHL